MYFITEHRPSHTVYSLEVGSVTDDVTSVPKHHAMTTYRSKDPTSMQLKTDSWGKGEGRAVSIKRSLGGLDVAVKKIVHFCTPVLQPFTSSFND
jgi:hypothetical protein